MPPRALPLALLAALLAGALLAGCTAPEEAAPAAPAPRLPEDEAGNSSGAAGPRQAGGGQETEERRVGASSEAGEGDAAGGAPLEERASESPMRLYVTADATPAEPCRGEHVNLAVAVEDATGAPVEGANVDATWRTGALGARVGNATDETGVANLTRAAPARTGAVVPIEVEVTEGRRYGAAIAFVTVADCGSATPAAVDAWLDEPWTAGGLPLPPDEAFD